MSNAPIDRNTASKALSGNNPDIGLRSTAMTESTAMAESTVKAANTANLVNENTGCHMTAVPTSCHGLFTHPGTTPFDRSGRQRALLKGDLRFQLRYGIVPLYGIFTILYVAILSALPVSWREKAALVMVFTDPAAMGLFFMGAMVLFEKSERVLDSLAVSPVKPMEYVLSKLVSVGLISTAVGLAIGLAGGAVRRPMLFLSGVFLCSCLFSAIALILARAIHSLNGFMLLTIPAELLIVLPPLLWLFFEPAPWLLLHPGVCMMMLCLGEGPLLAAFSILLLWTAIFVWLAGRTTAGMLKTVGGAKL